MSHEDEDLIREYEQMLRDGGMPSSCTVAEALDLEVCRRFGIGKNRCTVSRWIKKGWLRRLPNMGNETLLTPRLLAEAAVRRKNEMDAKKESAA